MARLLLFVAASPQDTKKPKRQTSDRVGSLRASAVRPNHGFTVFGDRLTIGK
jgi:hypothetical protein